MGTCCATCTSRRRVWLHGPKDQEQIRKRARMGHQCGTAQPGPPSISSAGEKESPSTRWPGAWAGPTDRGRKSRTASSDQAARSKHAAEPVSGVCSNALADKFCTYCIVPSVRGPEQSRPPEHILTEVRQLADQGCLEVTLVGQTVNSYRFVYGDGRVSRLSDLLALISDVGGIRRVKFITNFPRDMSDDLLEAVRDLPKVSKYLHVPAQHGCNDVLKRMKRLYTVEFYREMMAKCRAEIPEVAISSDFIVGFCGETDTEFGRAVDLVRESGFKNSFIFKYSARPGTKADELFRRRAEETKRRPQQRSTCRAKRREV